MCAYVWLGDDERSDFFREQFAAEIAQVLLIYSRQVRSDTWFLIMFMLNSVHGSLDSKIERCLSTCRQSIYFQNRERTLSHLKQYTVLLLCIIVAHACVHACMRALNTTIQVYTSTDCLLELQLDSLRPIGIPFNISSLGAVKPFNR